MQETPNLKLKTFDKTDGDVKFLDYRLAESENFEKIDVAVSQSSSDIEALGTTVEELKAKQVADKQELSNTIETVRVGLVAEDDAIKASVTELGKKVEANYAEMKATDTAIRGEITDLDTKIQGDISTAKTEINETISALESKHDTDIEAVNDKIFENDVLTKEALLGKADKNHTHTKADVGLGKVENYAVATMDEAVAGVATDKYMTPALVAEAIKWGGGTTFTNMSVELKQVIVSSYIETENQKVLTIPYEHFDKEIYLLELRIGGVPFFHERYTITDKTITLKENEVGFAKGKRADFVITYLEQVGDNKLPVHGKNLYNGSVTLEKLSQELQDKLGGIDGGGSSGGGMTEEEKEAIYTAINNKADKDHIHSAYEIAINKKAEKVHTHADLETAISEKADKNHIHQKYENIADGKADKNHTHPDLQTAIDGKANSTHSHSDLEQAIAGKSDSTHTHADLEQQIAGKANIEHTHDGYASSTHASTHGVGGSDEIQVVEDMLSDDLKRKINYSGDSDIGFPEIDATIEDVKALKEEIKTKADVTHAHADLSEKINTNTESINTTNRAVATKADKSYVDESVESLTGKIDGKANTVHTHADLAVKSEVEAKHAQYDLAMGVMNENIESKANASHTHTASQITGLPTSLPANGGNADSVDGVHFYPTNSAPLASNATPYIYAFNGGDDYNCYVKNLADVTVGSASNAHNATVVQGLDVVSILNGRGFNGTCTNVSDWDNAINNGFYMASGATNAPNTDWWMGYVIVHNANWVAQIVNNFNSTRVWKQRFKVNGTWTAWGDFGGSSSSVCILSNAYGSLDMALASSSDAEKTGNAKVDYQVGGWAESGGSVVVPTTGTYLCSMTGGIEVQSGSVNASNALNVSTSIMKNGSSSLFRLAPIYSNISSSGYGTRWHGFLGAYRYGNTGIVTLNAGDTLNFRGNLSSYYNNNPLTVSVRVFSSVTLTKL